MLLPSYTVLLKTALSVHVQCFDFLSVFVFCVSALINSYGLVFCFFNFSVCLTGSFTLTQSVSIHCSETGAVQCSGIREQQLLKCFRNRIVPWQGHGFCTNDFGSTQTFAVVVAVWLSANISMVKWG